MRHYWDGDGHADLLVPSSSGRLCLYPGDGRGVFEPRRQVGTGWHRYDQLGMDGDRDGDGRTDLLARHRSTGDLYLYRGNGSGGFLGRLRIGPGWSGFSQVLATGDRTGDGRADVLALRGSDQTLWSYPGDGRGGLGPRRLVNGGWQTRTALTAVGDWDGDHQDDVVARDGRNGALWLYRGDGAGDLVERRLIGRGWNALTAVLGSGDWSGDGRPELLRRNGSGQLVLYRGDGRGGFVAPYPAVGRGWSPYLLAGLPGFAATVSRVTAAQLPYSYRPGCPVGPASLRLLAVRYYGFDGASRTTEPCGRCLVSRAASPGRPAPVRPSTPTRGRPVGGRS